jgi:hypothetical protein
VECKFHPGEEAIDKCVLCDTPLCVKCLPSCQELEYGLLCPKCCRALGLSRDSSMDPIHFR